MADREHPPGGGRPTNCPTCHAPTPNLHPAVQSEGEVEPCRDPWHHDSHCELPEKGLCDCWRRYNANPATWPAPGPGGGLDREAAVDEALDGWCGDAAPHDAHEHRFVRDVCPGVERPDEAGIDRDAAREHALERLHFVIHHVAEEKPLDADGKVECLALGFVGIHNCRAYRAARAIIDSPDAAAALAPLLTGGGRDG